MINMLQMPLFFSVSGFCLVFTLTRGGGELNVISFLLNKCKRILLPSLIIGFFWLLPIRLLLRYPRYQNQSATTIIFKDLLWGNDNGHLWFLPTLFLMLALSIILVKLCGTGIRLDITMTVLSILFVAMFGLM